MQRAFLAGTIWILACAVSGCAAWQRLRSDASAGDSESAKSPESRLDLSETAVRKPDLATEHSNAAFRSPQSPAEGDLLRTDPRSSPTASPRSAAARGTAATESLDDAIQRLAANPSATPEDYSRVRQALNRPDAELPPLLKQQFAGLVDLLERQSLRNGEKNPVFLQPATHEHPASPARESASNSQPPKVLTDRDLATVATPHVTVNVHAGNPDPTANPSDPPAGVAQRIARSPAASPVSMRTADRSADVPLGGNSADGPPRGTRPPATSLPAQEPPPPTLSSNWQEQLARTIDLLDVELKGDAHELTPEERTRWAAYLRLLYVIANRHDEAVASIEAFDKSQQQYWQHQLHALIVSLDSAGTPVPTRRAAMALRELREATGHLAALSALDLRNLMFCSQVDSFGTYSPFVRQEFKPNQEVLLYVEIDNFTVEEKSAADRQSSYETELKGSYQILDAAGQRVADVELPLDKQSCRSRRRDYFIAYSLFLPKNIASGSYTLQLSIEDGKAKKFGQGSIAFKVKE